MGLLKIDRYSFKARVVPALIVILPAGVSVITLFPDKFVGWDLIVWLLGAGGVTILLEHLGRDWGLRKETDLFDSWGGKPSTFLLRHSNGEVNSETIKRYHRVLEQKTAIKAPTLVEEQNKPDWADNIYDSYGDYLRAKARNTERYHLVMEENINYGFRRNLWGMKSLGVILTMLSIVLVIIQGFSYWGKLPAIKPIVVVGMIIDVALLLIWLVVIKTSWVRTAAVAYAKQLLAICDRL